MAIIERVGFPIAVAAFVLIRLNGKMASLTDALNSLSKTIIERDEISRMQQDHDHYEMEKNIIGLVKDAESIQERLRELYDSDKGC